MLPYITLQAEECLPGPLHMWLPSSLALAIIPCGNAFATPLCHVKSFNSVYKPSQGLPSFPAYYSFWGLTFAGVLLGAGDTKNNCVWFQVAVNSRLGFIFYIFPIFVLVVTIEVHIWEQADNMCILQMDAAMDSILISSPGELHMLFSAWISLSSPLDN